MKNDLTKQERLIYIELMLLKQEIKMCHEYQALKKIDKIKNMDFTFCSMWLHSLFFELATDTINLKKLKELPLSISGVVPDEKPTSNSTWSYDTQKIGFVSTFVSARRNDGIVPCVDTSFFSCAGYLALELRRDSTYVQYVVNLRGKYIIFKSYVSLHEYLKEYFKNTISESLFQNLPVLKLWSANEKVWFQFNDNSPVIGRYVIVKNPRAQSNTLDYFKYECS